jgi:phosphate transport system substrate-binding protein
MKSTRVALAIIMALGLQAGAFAAQITGAGSTLAQPVYQKWADASAASTGITLNYQGVGSGAGTKLIMERTVDFGASDAPLSHAKLAQANLLQFPTVIGAVDIAVNIPGVASGRLKLTGAVVAAIYMGDITNWNAPEIAALNPGLKLPDLAVAPVYRADGSGTTYVQLVPGENQPELQIQGRGGQAIELARRAGCQGHGRGGRRGEEHSRRYRLCGKRLCHLEPSGGGTVAES